MKTAAIPALLAAALVLGAFPADAKPKARPVAAQDDAAPSSTALIVQARGAVARGETELALRLAQSAIVAAPASTDPYIALGDVYVAAGRQDYARAYYEEALQIDPLQPAALKALAALDKRPAP